jgi:hypothetical protein
MLGSKRLVNPHDLEVSSTWQSASICDVSGRIKYAFKALATVAVCVKAVQ